MQRAMKRTCCLLLVLAAAGLSAAPPKMMSVTVEQTQARAAPSFLGKIVADLSYGDRIEVLEEKNGWARIVMGGQAASDAPAAWVHMSALTTKRIVLKAGDVDVSQTASSAEVALAGKGFNEQVEAEYRLQMGLDYAWVDRMEGITVSWGDIRAFLAGGGLAPLEEGQ